ncbi:UDP-glycosyltransferase 91A1-like [Camellia sinensis]|uniref:Glycosyltransferase n=1 Tax=Camellia sinensis var. sinensis TaxID=542762 RepID=A0A4S4EA97_CAMSN|nr:UDP-glycosyltransferase 91A1-like [Camellia sinensis]THG13090.1 hypothetical protein TEA_018094 [Camellia sinensis var. sinensis]
MESMPKWSSSSSSCKARDETLHIVMFPWLAFGHMLPFLELSKLIAQNGHRVSLISTPRNIHRLPKLPPNLSPLINLVKLQLPKVDQLPQNAESTLDLPHHKVKYLMKAYDQLQQPMSQILSDLSPHWVIYDFAPYWFGPLASKLGISRVFFSVCVAPALCFLGPVPVLKRTSGEDDRTTPEDFTAKPKWIPFESKIGFKLFEIKSFFNDTSTNYANVPITFRFGAGIEACDVLAVRSSYEFEPEWLKLMEEVHMKPVIPIGQLPSSAYDDSFDETWYTMKESKWLDKQSNKSVVYVAFGGDTKPSQTQLTEIAFGLELSELSFFWVLRNRRGVDDTEVTELPDGFEERTKERGVVYTNWAPQLKILSHDSVGGFLSHSGLSSVVEALQFGKSLILLPFMADTGLIARHLEEKKMACLVPRDERDGSFTRNSVADSLRLVMVEEEGRIYRDKAKEMSGLFGNRAIQDKYVNNFVDYLKKHRPELAQEE